MQDKSDEKFMEKALELAMLGKGHTNPNPLVGAIIVMDGNIVGMGFHEKYGQPHAEVNAVNSVGGKVEGATIYVTLEPCCHFGKTPPCTKLLIENKIKKVVIGTLDPNPLVAGKGVEMLLEAGIEVEVGILQEKCKILNEVFNKYITTKRPFVVLKAATSLDGKIADDFGESKWITSEAARTQVQQMRNKYSAIMVGVETVIKDNPKLTCRITGGRNPVRIIVDSQIRTPNNSFVLTEQEQNQTIIACTEKAPKERIDYVDKLGAKVIVCKSLSGRVDLDDLMDKLGETSIDSILLEGGATINQAALNQGIVDKLVLYMAPKIIGGQKSKSFVEGFSEAKLEEAYAFDIESIDKVGADLKITAYVSKKEQH